jgi:hypothetical protein
MLKIHENELSQNSIISLKANTFEENHTLIFKLVPMKEEERNHSSFLEKNKSEKCFNPLHPLLQSLVSNFIF